MARMAGRTLLLAWLAFSHAAMAAPLDCKHDEYAYRHEETLLCHRLTPPVPFAKALASCRQSNSHLVTVVNADHNAFLYSIIASSSFIGAVQRRVMLRHPTHEGPGVVWAWLSGRTSEFVNVLEVETTGYYAQPDGGGFEGCMELMKHPVLEHDYGNSKWGDTDCRAPKPGICVRTLRRSDDDEEKQTMPQTSVAQRTPVVDDSPRGRCAEQFRRVPVTRLTENWNYLGRSACLSDMQHPAEYDAALKSCQSLHPGAVVWHAARRQTMRVRPAVAHLPGRLWTGADRRDPLLTWRWQGGGDVHYTAWAAGEPQDNIELNCAVYDTSLGGLAAVSCGEKLPYLCETPAEGCLPRFHLDGTGARCKPDWKPHCLGITDKFRRFLGMVRVTPAACATALCRVSCPAGTTAHAGTCYTIHERSMTMTDAKQFCNHTMGLQVVIAANAADNEFLRRQAVRLGRPVWTEVSDRFSNYHRYVAYGLPDEPNEGPGACTVVWYDGEWMDVPCDEKFAVVCALPLRRTDCLRANQP